VAEPEELETRVIVRNETARLRATIWGEGHSVGEPDGVTPLVELPSSGHNFAPWDVEGALLRRETWCRTRRYVVNGVPVLLASSYVPLGLAEGTRIVQEDTGPGGTYARLADAGHAPVRFRQDLTAKTVEEAQARALIEDLSAPVLVAIRTAYDAEDAPVECSELIYDPTQITVRFEFPA
jgi:GntR family transcriptional regulator